MYAIHSSLICSFADPSQPPSSASAHPSSSNLWPGHLPPPHPSGASAGPSAHPYEASLLGLDRVPPAVLQSHYHQLYLQQQQLRSYYHHHHLASAAAAASADPLRMGLRPPLTSEAATSSHHRLHHLPSGSKKMGDTPRKEPETIMISDDDSEDEAAKKTSSSKQRLPLSKEIQEKAKISPSATNLPKIEDKKNQPENSPPENDDSISTAVKPADLSLACKQTAESRPKTPAIQPAAVAAAPRQLFSPAAEAEEAYSKQNFPSITIKEEPKDALETAELSNHTNFLPEEDLKFLAESLIQLSEVKSEVIVKQEQTVTHDFDILLRGIELSEKVEDGIDVLCAVTNDDSHHVPYYSSHFTLTSRLDVLYCVTKGDKIEFDQYVDPMLELKKLYNLHDYHTSDSAESIQVFIQNKSQYFKKLAENPEGCFVDDKEPPSLAKILKKIKNTEIGSELEVELRNKLMELQDIYREKQSELTRLKSSPRKRMKSKRGSKANKRTPRRTPKKLTPKQRRNSHSPGPQNNPPTLEPSGSSSPPRLQSWKQSSEALLKPPKLTASSSTQNMKRSVTNLSTINARFMKGKINPFANLLSKLAPTPSTSTTPNGSQCPSPTKQMPDISEEDEEATNEGVATNEEVATNEGVEQNDEIQSTLEDSNNESEDSNESSEEIDEYTFHDDEEQLLDRRHYMPGKRGRSSSLEDSSSSKKRKADKPKKQSGTTETIVPKKPKNLFMMNCYEYEGGYGKEDDTEADSEAAFDRLEATGGPSDDSETEKQPLVKKSKKPTLQQVNIFINFIA